MKLRALHLTNVRKFTGKQASITGIGDGITVVSEANEFGKSTFFDAIHALFFEKYSSSAKPVKSLQPYAGGAVEVAADIDTDDCSFRVEKRFLSRKGAKITRLSDGATVAQDDEAERWISALLGSAGDGPAGLLWVRQGVIGLEPDGAKEKTQLMETRRDLLSSVAGEIDEMTGGRRMDRVMRRVTENLSEIATKTGRERGAWKAASDEVGLLEENLASVTAQVETLDDALRERKQVEAALTRLDAPEAKTRRNAALSAAQSAMEHARTHVGAVTSARQERDLAALHANSAKSDLDAFLKAIDTLQTAEGQAVRSTAEANKTKNDADQLKTTMETAQALHKTALGAVEASRNQLEATRRQLETRKAKAVAAQLEAQITKAETAISERDAALAKTKASRATPDWLRRAEEAEGEVTKFGAAVRSKSSTLSITYEGMTRITSNGAVVPEDQTVALDGDTRLELPGIGQMTIRTHSDGGEVKTQLVEAEASRDDLLAQVGVDTIQKARTQAANRVEQETATNLAQAVLDTLAPDGIDLLRTAKAEADLAAAEAHDDPLSDIANLEQILSQSGVAEDMKRQVLDGAEANLAAAREHSIRAQATADSLLVVLGRAESDAGPEIEREASTTARLRAVAKASDTLRAAESNLESLISTAPDLETATAELQRAENAMTAASQQRAQAAERLAALSSEIRTLAGQGIEERRDDLAGQLGTARAIEARFAHLAAALSRLHIELEAARDAARETYFGPVQEELKPLLSILHRDAALSFDSESLLPTGLMRYQTEEILDNLSGGTKEQIAILTRLAFAKLFARQGRHMPIVLDDALVYSDDDRIIKMFTALTRVAKDQQIFVFSCRQLAFQDLGGARPTVEIIDV